MDIKPYNDPLFARGPEELDAHAYQTNLKTHAARVLAFFAKTKQKEAVSHALWWALIDVSYRE